MVLKMGKNSNWFVLVKKAFRPKLEKKKRVKTGRSKWMCRGKRRLGSDSSTSEEEPDGVATGELELGPNISEPKQVSFTGIEALPTTELGCPLVEQVNDVETVWAPTKEERSSEIVHEPFKEEVTAIATIPTEHMRTAETVSQPTQEAKLAETIVAPIEEERKPSETDLELTRRENFAEIVSVPTLLIEKARLAEVGNDENKRAYSVALATAAAAEAVAAAARAAVEVVRLATAVIPRRVQARSREELAAIKIQSIFRGYLARRALRALRGLERLKSLIDGNAVKHQSSSTLRCTQMFARVQGEVHSRRIGMSEENQAQQDQLLLKHHNELEILRKSTEEDWNNSTQSKERIKDNLIHKQEGVIRRERAMAYAFSHQQQWRHPAKSTNPLHLDAHDPHWEWNSLERWLAARPWENSCTTDHSDAASVRSFDRRAMTDERPKPVSVKPLRTSMRFSPSRPSSVTGRPSLSGRPKLRSSNVDEDDSRSSLMCSRRNRRNSISPSCTRDDESITSAPCMPSYMQSTQSTRAKARLGSPTGEKQGAAEIRTPDSLSKKQHSVAYIASSRHGRRLSHPGKAETSSASERADSEPIVSSGILR